MRETPGCLLLIGLLALMPMSVLWLCQCGGATPQPCNQTALSALRELHAQAAKDVIQAGRCDAYEKIENCPAYMLVEKHFVTTSEALCSSKK